MSSLSTTEPTPKATEAQPDEAASPDSTAKCKADKKRKREPVDVKVGDIHADPEPVADSKDDLSKRAALERESLVKGAIAVPFKVGEKVLLHVEGGKKECFVKKILPEQGCVLVQADDGLCSWVDGRQCSRVLVDGKPVLEPKIEINISFPNTKENSEPATSTASGTSTLRRRTPEEMERIMAPYRKRQEDNKRRHEETFENLESSKKAIVEKIRNLVGKGAVNFQESVQSRNGYLCTICESEAPEFLNGYVDDEWTDDGGRKYGALPLKRLLEDSNATIRWEDTCYFVTANVYLK